MVENKIKAYVSLILIEIVIGAILGVIPPPVSDATISDFKNNPTLSVATETGQSWLELAEKTNSEFFLWRGVSQIFFIIGAPILTTISLIRST